MNTRVKFGSALSLFVGQFSVGVNILGALRVHPCRRDIAAARAQMDATTFAPDIGLELAIGMCTDAVYEGVMASIPANSIRAWVVSVDLQRLLW